MTPQELEREFQRWKQSGQPPGYVKSAGIYLHEALPAEREAAASGVNGLDLTEIKKKGPLKLICNAGSTPQATLLAVALVEPNRLLLVGSDTEEGKSYLEKTEELIIERWPEMVLHTQLIDDRDATSAFRALDGVLRRNPGTWIVDITGGKKSMATTAFFLALEHHTPTVYLDGSWDADVRHLRPCTSHLIRMRDPAAGLGLYSLRRAKTHWDKLNFAAAADDLREVQRLFVLDEVAFPRSELKQIQLALAAAEACVAWEQSRYADISAGAIPGLPEAVRTLANVWRGLGNPEVDVRSRPELLARYLIDASRWLSRTGVRSPSLCFLRRFALGELAAWGMVATVDSTLLSARGGYVPWKEICDAAQQTWPAFAPWAPRSRWRTLRNSCAHGLAEVSATQLDEIAENLRAVILACLDQWRHLGRNTPPSLDAWLVAPLESDIPPLESLLPTLFVAG